MYYTIGQRRGLGIGGISGREAKSWFVTKKDVKNNILYVASGDDDEHLLSDKAIIKMVNFNADKPIDGEMITCKFRYRQQDLPVYIHLLDEETVELSFVKPYKAVTTGQAAVFYQGDVCLGGGIIDQVYYKNKRIDI